MSQHKARNDRQKGKDDRDNRESLPRSFLRSYSLSEELRPMASHPAYRVLFIWWYVCIVWSCNLRNVIACFSLGNDIDGVLALLAWLNIWQLDWGIFVVYARDVGWIPRDIALARLCNIYLMGGRNYQVVMGAYVWKHKATLILFGRLLLVELIYRCLKLSVNLWLLHHLFLSQ